MTSLVVFIDDISKTFVSVDILKLLNSLAEDTIIT